MSRLSRFVGFFSATLFAGLAQWIAESAHRALTHPPGCDYNLVKHMAKPPFGLRAGRLGSELIRRFGDYPIEIPAEHTKNSD